MIAVFDKATKHLGGQKYPTFVSALPCLRTIKLHLDNDRMFDNTHEVSSAKKFQSKFQSLYGECPFFGAVLGKLDSCRKKLLEDFKQRFRGMDIKYLWTSLFDPRYAAASHLTEVEKVSATASMKQELRSLIVPFLGLPSLDTSPETPNDAIVLFSEDDGDSEFDDVSFEPIGSVTPSFQI